VFYDSAWITDEHDGMLPEKFFPVVGQISRFPRYTNDRIVDPQLKCFVDEMGIEIPKAWGLPKPNAAAAYKSLSKYGKSVPAMSQEQVNDMNLAWEWTGQHFGLYMQNSNIISYEDAKEHLDWTTSVGAPFNTKYNNKKDLFENEGSEIDEWLLKDWETMAYDLQWTCLFTNSLKEELRTIEKMDENSIRTFLSGGLDAVIHGTRLFVDMNEKMYAAHLVSASAVGMSPLKGKWNRLYQKLKVFKKGYALDESQYDSSLRAYMMWGCCRFRWTMLKPEFKTTENLQRMRVYYRNLINTVVICPDGVLVMKKTGNPSGSVNTISDNTLVLYTLMAYAWCRNAPKEFKSYSCFEAHTSKALVGDDNTWTVSDDAHEFYNAHSVINEWKQIGVTTTTDSMEPRPAEDLDFLSAHTVFLGNKAVPVYDRVKLMTSLLYAPKAHLTPATTLERAAGMLCVGWTDIPFRNFCRDLIEWLLQKYDRTMCDDPKWIAAKCGIQTDVKYFTLFTGTIPLRNQGFSGDKESATPEKKKMVRVNRNRNGTKPGKKTIKTVIVGRRAGTQKVRVRTTSRANGPRRNRNGARQQRPRRGRMLTGRDNPRTGMRAVRTCTVTEDEFIQPVMGSVGYAVTQYPINPGQSTTFPWLSKQAAQWEKYWFTHLEFYYKRDVSEFATNGTTGKVMFGVDFDASDPPPISKQQIEDTDPHMDCMPSEGMRMPLNARQLHGLYKKLYVRPAGLPGASDIKTYDCGNFNLATQGMQNTTEIGELRVRYTVVFEVPVLEAGTQAPTNNSVSQFIDVSSQNTGISGAFVNDLLATSVTNGLAVSNVGGGFILPTGNYLVDYYVNAVGAIANVGTWDLTKNTVSVAGATIVAMTSGGDINGGFTMYVTSNGTDVFQLRASASAATVITYNGGLRLVSI